MSSKLAGQQPGERLPLIRSEVGGRRGDDSGDSYVGRRSTRHQFSGPRDEPVEVVIEDEGAHYHNQSPLFASGKDLVFKTKKFDDNESVNNSKYLSSPDIGDVVDRQLYAACLFSNDPLSASPAAAAAIVAEKEESDVPKAPTGPYVKLGMFTLAALMAGMHPLIYEWSLRNPATGEKEMHFVAATVTVGYFLVSVILGNISAAYLEGIHGIKRCWSGTAILVMLPMSAVFALAEILDLYALLYIDGALRNVIMQLKLPLSALASCVFLNHRLSSIQWSLVAGMTFAVMGYSATSIEQAATSSSSMKAETLGLVYVAGGLTLTTAGALLAEVLLKRRKDRLPTLMSQSRLTAGLASCAAVALECSNNDTWWKLPFYGWTWRIILLVIWLSLKDYSTTIVIKHMSVIWKAFATAVGLCITFVAQLILIGRPFNFILLAFIMNVVIDVIAYALTKRQQLNAENSGSNIVKISESEKGIS